jgi:hypothetical protein
MRESPLVISLADARQIIETWRVDDTAVRPHSALGNLTPQAYCLQQWSAQYPQYDWAWRRHVNAHPCLELRCWLRSALFQHGTRRRQEKGRRCSIQVVMNRKSEKLLTPEIKTVIVLRWTSCMATCQYPLQDREIHGGRLPVDPHRRALPHHTPQSPS